MQTQTFSRPLPTAPDSQPRTRTNWTATLVAGGVGLLMAVTAIFFLQSRSSELARTRESLSSAQATVSSQSGELNTTRDALSSARASLSSTQSDLHNANGALRITLRCAAATLAAWYSTTNDTYTMTGLVLQRAVNSRACRDVRRAENASGGTA
jgi:hypothetical protein